MAATDDTENISTVKKKGRGGAKPWAEWNNDEKKILEWNEKCQPVCALQSKLMSQLGHYAKNGIYFPLTMLSWDSADESVLKYIWEEVQAMAQKNSKNREAECAYSRTGRTPHCKVAHEKAKRGEPIDDITMWKSTRDPKNKSFRTEDGSADRAAMLERRLNELPQEEQNDFEMRNMIFRDVVGQGGHGHSLLKGRGIKTTSTRENAILTALSDENNQLKKDAEDREIRHKEELLKMKEDTTNELYRILESVGISAPRQTVGTLDSDEFGVDE